MKNAELEIIGIFPAFDSEAFGGVQASGSEAWQGIVSGIGEQRAEVLCYKAGSSKARVVFSAISNRRSAKVVLVWHLHLLKLLPFLDSSASRVILFLHGIEAWLKQDALTRRMLQKVNLVLFNSDHTWQRFIACNPEFGSKQRRAVHLGAGERLQGATPRPTQAPAALMVGRLNKDENYKGHRQMIEAWPLVLERVTGAELWIVGDGNLRPDLERLARERAVAGSVRFYGQVPDVEKDRLIAQSRCLALPSRGEGFGLVYLEAMRQGRPCLVSNLDAGREVVNPPEAGLAVDPNDAQGIADAVERLLTLGPGWDNWSAQARARYENNFTGAQFQSRLLSAVFES